ncbi:MAG: hypothetical protein ACRC4O_05110 [Giesbergeria sp.]
MNMTSIVHALLSSEPKVCEDAEAARAVLGLVTDQPARLQRVLQDLARRGQTMGVCPGHARLVSLADLPDGVRVVSVAISSTMCEMAFLLGDGAVLHVRQSGDDMYAWVS